MRTKFKLLTWDIQNDCLFSREFRNESRAIETAQALRNRRVWPHDIIVILRTRETGHRWELAVWSMDKPSKKKYITFYSKKDSIFAIKNIKEYDDTLKVDLTKLY